MLPIVNMIYGSHLYGTNTKDSDTDYKGVYRPDIETCILGKVEKSISKSTGNSGSKNKTTDIDSEYYSIQHFIKLACAGETVAIDMLHTPDKFIIYQSPTWNSIRSQRSKFYTKNIKAFTEYAKNQASKYSIKGDRLKAAEEVYMFLNKLKKDHLLKEVIDLIHLNEHVSIFNDDNQRYISVCGRKFGETHRIGYVCEQINKIINTYGNRTKQAKDASGIDWKAISHALRVTLEIEEILKTGDLVFPLKDAKMLLNIKRGFTPIDWIMYYLDLKIERVEELSKKSSLPESVDIKYWEEMIVELYKK